MKDEPREMTEDEVRDVFLNHIRDLITYWHDEARAADCRAKMEGLAFSILVMLDGGAGLIPGFKVIANPHEDDKEFHRSQGENWYPTDLDIGGALHEHFSMKGKR